jgi:poly(hydroxyalkanoate) granule-associated protein
MRRCKRRRALFIFHHHPFQDGHPISDAGDEEYTMVKKLKALAEHEETQFANAVRASAQQIWQAGLGAFAKAQEEGGRMFSLLVQEGSALQKRTRARAEDEVAELGATVGKVADDVSAQAAGSWDKLEQVFEDRVARALGAIGVPTQKELQAMSGQLDRLSAAVAELAAQTAPAKRRARGAAATAAPARSAAGKAVKKTASKVVVTAAVEPVKANRKAARKPPAKKASGVAPPAP